VPTEHPHQCVRLRGEAFQLVRPELDVPLSIGQLDGQPTERHALALGVL
jgi:hypothetical protein